LPTLTPAQRAYIRRKTRRSDDDRMASSGELNIVPFLDIVVNLIMFLLMTSATVLGVSEIEARLPSWGPHRGGGPEAGALRLSVTLADPGIVVAGSNGVVAPGCDAVGPGGVTVPGRDWSSLRACLRRIKDRHPGERELILSADPTVPYEELVRAMDTVRADARGELFPELQLSAGVR
jgi:biopolymer transport protein TolR